VSVREATPADLAVVMDLTRQLAAYEQLEHELACTAEDLERALFGPEAVISVSLAVAEDGEVVGHALWYPTFSTFLGTTGIWLEDLFVRPEHRGQGHGRDLLAHLRGLTTGRVEWDVLDWNTSAMAFYRSLGAEPREGWTKFRWVEGGS